MKRTDFQFIKAGDLLGAIDRKEIVRLANEGLVEPINQTLMELALCDPEDQDCVDRAKAALFRDAGIENMDKLTAMEIFAFVICGEIDSGELDPIAGASQISRLVIASEIDGKHRFDPFIYIDSEVEDRQSERLFFSKAAKREAEIFIKSSQIALSD